MRRDETVGEALRRRGISRRTFLQFSSLVASSLALAPSAAAQVAEALAAAKRRSVIWLSFQECTGCTESILRSHSPTLEELIFDFISLDYHHALQAVSGHAAEKAREDAMREHKGKYLVIVDGSIPVKDGGVYSTIAGITNLQMFEETVKDAFAVVALGTCAAFGGIPYAKPNPTGAVPVSELLPAGIPLINVSGCPPMPTVITGVLSHVLAFGAPPALDHLNRPLAFFGDSIHDRCYRRPFYNEGKFADTFDDEGARKGYCLYKVGCKGPTTYNACSTVRWNEGTSFPIQSGHGCIGCSEDGFWDQGSFYNRVTELTQFGVEANADQIGMAAAGVVGTGIAAHAAVSALKSAQKKTQDRVSDSEEV